MLSQGDILNAYEVQSVIGRGGFGVVYQGNHRELGIDVAIKEYFPPELSVRQNQTIQPSNPELQESFEEGLNRFLEEAKQLENFRDCPNIVTCRDLFRTNGTAYMVMDYVYGLPLSLLLEQRESQSAAFTEQDLLNLILPLLNGLQTVHDAGVCHRDIKPSNILVRRSDGIPILIDFGAAKHEISRQTKSFAPYTDGYAAMEQVGEGKIGPWTDMYGLGAVMWRVVAGGNPPFTPPNPTPTQRRAFEVMQGRADPFPSAKEIGKGRFSDKTLQAIDDCLIVNVSKRTQSCRELLNALDKSSIFREDDSSEYATDLEDNEAKSQNLALGQDNKNSTTDDLKVSNGKALIQIRQMSRPAAKLFKETARIVVRTRLVSASQIANQFCIDYMRAVDIITQLEKAGIVGTLADGKPRKVLISNEAALEELFRQPSQTFSTIPSSTSNSLPATTHDPVRSMTQNNNSPMLHAQDEASFPSVAGWFFCGLILGLIGLLIVYLRSPKAPVSLIARYQGDDRYLFEKAYIEILKARQVKLTWIGFICSFILIPFIFIFLLAGLFGLALV